MLYRGGKGERWQTLATSLRSPGSSIPAGRAPGPRAARAFPAPFANHRAWPSPGRKGAGFRLPHTGSPGPPDLVLAHSAGSPQRKPAGLTSDRVGGGPGAPTPPLTTPRAGMGGGPGPAPPPPSLPAGIGGGPGAPSPPPPRRPRFRIRPRPDRNGARSPHSSNPGATQMQAGTRHARPLNVAALRPGDPRRGRAGGS